MRRQDGRARPRRVGAGTPARGGARPQPRRAAWRGGLWRRASAQRRPGVAGDGDGDGDGRACGGGRGGRRRRAGARRRLGMATVAGPLE